VTVEQQYAELFVALSAHRLELLRIAGNLAKRSAEMAAETTSPKVQRWASETELDAVAIAVGAKSLSERADGLLDDTQVGIDVASLADE
jgi:hypothetical protein